MIRSLAFHESKVQLICGTRLLSIPLHASDCAADVTCKHLTRLGDPTSGCALWTGQSWKSAKVIQLHSLCRVNPSPRQDMDFCWWRKPLLADTPVPSAASLGRSCSDAGSRKSLPVMLGSKWHACS
jgi:hypothetical protein